MSVRLFALLAITPAVGLVAGCGARPSPLPAVELRAGPRALPPEASREGEILLWGKTGEEEPKTFRIAADGSGQILGEESRVVIATSKGDLVFDLSPHEVALDGCAMGDEPKPPAGQNGTGTLTVASLRTPDGVTAQTVVGEDYSGSLDVREMEHSVTLLGSIGAILFLHQQTYLYACGAHGMTMASFLMWDAEAGKPVEMLDEVPDKAGLCKKAAAKLEEEEPTDPAARLDEGLPELVQLLPAYGLRGALRVDAQFTRWACYACSDGLWSSYSRSVILETNWMPARFSGFATPPVSVKVFLEHRPGFELGGWSRR